LDRWASGIDRRPSDQFWREQQNKKSRSLEVVPGWFRAPVADVPEHTALIGKIRELRKLRMSWTTMANRLNEAGFPSRYGAVWHSTGVLLFAERAGLVRRRTKRIAPQYVLDRIAGLLNNEMNHTMIADNLNAARIRPVFGLRWDAGDVRFIAEQARLTDPPRNSATPKRVVNKIKALLKANKKWAAIAEELNAAHVPSGWAEPWYPSDVRLIAKRARL